MCVDVPNEVSCYGIKIPFRAFYCRAANDIKLTDTSYTIQVSYEVDIIIKTVELKLD